MMRRLLGLCGVCALGLIVVSAAQANLIVNGSFEHPILASGLTQTYKTGDVIGSGGWKVVGPNAPCGPVGNSVVLVQKNYAEALYGISAFNAQDGLNSLDLSGPANAGLRCWGSSNRSVPLLVSFMNCRFYVGRAVSDPAIGASALHEQCDGRSQHQ